MVVISILAGVALLGRRGHEATVFEAKVWHSEFHLERQFAKRVHAVLSSSVRSPETTDGTLKCFALIPPSNEIQTVRACHISCRELPELKEEVVGDENDPSRKYKMIQFAVGNGLLATKLHVDIVYDLDLYTTGLAPGPSLNGPDKLKASEFDSAATKTFDFKNPEYRQYSKQAGLIKRASESNFNFAYRAYRFLCSDLAVRTTQTAPDVPVEDWRVSFLCKPTMRNPGCGNCAMQFVGILRANGIPARLLSGRWAKNTEGGYGQYHVRTDFFDTDIGWIPVDPTFGFGEIRSERNVDVDFGTNNADFITMHENDGVHPEGGNFEMPIHQFGITCYFGSCPYNPRFNENWTVTDL